MGATIEACMDDENEARQYFQQCEIDRPIHDGLLFHRSDAREKQLQHFFDTHGTNEDSDYSTSSNNSKNYAASYNAIGNENQTKKEVVINSSEEQILEAYRMLKDNEETNSCIIHCSEFSFE